MPDRLPSIVSFSAGKDAVRAMRHNGGDQPDRRGRVVARIAYDGLRNRPLDDVDLSLREARLLLHMLAGAIAQAETQNAARLGLAETDVLDVVEGAVWCDHHCATHPRAENYYDDAEPGECEASNWRPLLLPREAPLD